MCSEDGTVCCLFSEARDFGSQGEEGWAGLCALFCSEGHSLLLSMDLQRMLLPAFHLVLLSFPGALGGGLWRRAWEGVDALLVSQLPGSVFSPSLSSYAESQLPAPCLRGLSSHPASAVTQSHSPQLPACLGGSPLFHLFVCSGGGAPVHAHEINHEAKEN